MQASNYANEQQDRRELSIKSSKLDERYGKIGIQAVAAAVRCRGKERKSERLRIVPQDCD
jgi:hypothetical protein